MANRFDVLLGAYSSYGGTYWHRDGGLRVRIARDRADSALARKVASRAITRTTTAIVGGLRIEPTDVSLRDLRAWAARAWSGLSYLTKSDVVSVGVDELCQYVEVFVSSPATARLSATEQSRYVVSGVPVQDDHSRNTDASPYYGAVPLWPDSGSHMLGTAACTTGYTMVRSGTRFASTAGHCGGAGIDAWYTTGNYVGSEWLNPFNTSHSDVQLLAYMSYLSPIWWGGQQAEDTRLVTAKEALPMLGQPVWIDGANSGRLAAEVSNRWSVCANDDGKEAVAAKVSFWYGLEPQGGDSGAPVAVGNGATSRTDDVTALGIHICHIGSDGWYTRVDTMEDATDSTLVLSSP